MKKKGQLTIFIIVAVIVVAIIAVFFIFKGNFGIEKTSSEVSPIYTKTLSCLEITSEEGISYVALHGGYYKIPEEITMSYFTDEVPYYYINSIKNVPSTDRVERELENYIYENLEYCVNFSSFEEQGFVINKGNLSVSLSIDEEKINIKANYPLAIKKGESASRLSEFKVNIISNIEKLRIASEEITNLYNENPGFVCLTCLDDASSKYDIEAKATLIQDMNVIWFSITDSESELNWRFVVEQ